MVRSIRDLVLDFSINYSFDKSGFNRHKKEFVDDISSVNLNGLTGLVTGGTSGIGQAVVNFTSGHGAKCLFTGRRNLNNENYIKCDLVNWNDIKKIIPDLPVLDFLVLNAGAMPETLEKNLYGVESQFASQVFGHYFLLKGLVDGNKLKKGAKVIWVTSGGMYLKNLDLDTVIDNPQYNKVSTYANAKRAQVSINRYFAENRLFPDLKIFVMHPGWVNTSGLKNALPGFTVKLNERLRNAEEGADTINWLIAVENESPKGKVWFDRKIRTDSFFPWIRYNRKKTQKLISQLEHYYLLVFGNNDKPQG